MWRGRGARHRCHTLSRCGRRRYDGGVCSPGSDPPAPPASVRPVQPFPTIFSLFTRARLAGGAHSRLRGEQRLTSAPSTHAGPPGCARGSVKKSKVVSIFYELLILDVTLPARHGHRTVTHHMGTLASRGACACALAGDACDYSDRSDSASALYYPYPIFIILAPGSSYTLYVACL